MARDQRERLQNIEEELEDVKKRLGRIWNHIETTDTEMADASDRIREHRERKEKLEIAAEEARALLKERRQFLDSARHHCHLRRRDERVPQDQRADRDQSLRRLLRQGGRGQARQGRHRLLHTHAGGFSHRGSGRRRDRPEWASYEFGTSWWARQESNLGPAGYEPAALPLSYGPLPASWGIGAAATDLRYPVQL